MTASEELKAMMVDAEVGYSDIARHMHTNRQSIHYLLNISKDIRTADYSAIKSYLISKGATHKVDTSVTLSVSTLNLEASQLMSKLVRALEDGCIDTKEKNELKQTLAEMQDQIDILIQKVDLL